MIATLQAEVTQARQMAIQTRRALDEQRRQTCNRAARIMRSLGLSAQAEQVDPGRRDAAAVIPVPGADPFYDSVKVGVFYDGAVEVLSPHRFGSQWIPVRRDLSDLATVLRAVVKSHLMKTSP